MAQRAVHGSVNNPVVISTWHAAREAYRSRYLRQGLYDGGVVMDNVLINLHGTEHRDRRRLENPLFRREVLFRYERESFPAVLEARLAPGRATGKLELLSFGHSLMLELAAINAGLDLDLSQPDATERLQQQLLQFIDGARILHYTGDKTQKELEVAAALAAFDREFLQPASARRERLLRDRDLGLIDEAELPRDILRVLLENVQGLDLDDSTILRETAFFLLTGASTSAAALTLTLDNIFRWLGEHPDDRSTLQEDPTFVQRCIFESLRLAPISPIGARWATDTFELSDGTAIAAGDRVHIDMRAANRDPSVWGSTSDEFQPRRKPPEGAPLHGLSFGHGMHHCIGQELAVGVEPADETGFDDRLFGLVGVVIQELIRSGVAPDPTEAPEIDPLSERQTFSRYPVLLTRT